MASLADSAQLVGFFSGSRADDEALEGALFALRDRTSANCAQPGRSATDFRLWQDKAVVAPGTLWEMEIEAAVAQSVFFIPVVAPTTLRTLPLRMVV